jgi:hypothetical protein
LDIEALTDEHLDHLHGEDGLQLLHIRAVWRRSRKTLPLPSTISVGALHLDRTLNFLEWTKNAYLGG